MIRFILAFKNNISGGSASGNVTIPSTDIIVSGFSDERFNGRYSMQDTSATGIYRVWVKDDIRIQTDMDTDENMALWRFVNDEWNNEDNPSIAHSHMPYENPWDTEEWFVYTDYHGISGTPVVTLASGGSDIGGDAATSTDIIVSGHSNPDVNGTYKLVDESATGYNRQWVKDGNPLLKIYSCHSEGGHDWVLDFGNDGYVCGSGLEIGIDNPVDVQTWFDVNDWGTPPKFEWASGNATSTPAAVEVVVSGLNKEPEFNGTYKLIDQSATGFDRVWKNENGMILAFDSYNEQWYLANKITDTGANGHYYYNYYPDYPDVVPLTDPWLSTYWEGYNSSDIPVLTVKEA